MKNIFLMVFVLLQAFTLQAKANFSIESGWRGENIGSTVERTFDPDHETRAVVASLYVHDLSIWELGAKASWEGDCTPWYVKGEYVYGNVISGTMEHQHNIGNQSLGGYSLEYNVAVGRVFDVCGCFDFVPLIGYSYNKLYFTANNMIRYTNQFDYFLDYPVVFNDSEGPFSNRNTIYSYTPFVGFDLRFCSQFCERYNVNFTLGYEFHYGHGSARRKISEESFSITLLSLYQFNGDNFHVNIKRLIMNVFSFEATTQFCGCWEAGVNVKYTVTTNTGKDNLKLGRFDELVDAGYYEPYTTFPFFLNRYTTIQARAQIGYNF